MKAKGSFGISISWSNSGVIIGSQGILCNPWKWIPLLYHWIRLGQAHSMFPQGCWHSSTSLPFGVGTKFQYLAIHRKASNLNPISDSLFQYHIFTNFDTVSAFTGIGKKSAGDGYFLWTSLYATVVSEASMLPVERLVVLM